MKILSSSGSKSLMSLPIDKIYQGIVEEEKDEIEHLI